MKERQLAEALMRELAARQVPCRLGDAVPYGQKVSVLTDHGATLGSLICYWGKKGPKVTRHELQRAAGTSGQRLEEAVDAAIRRATGALDLAAGSAAPEHDQAGVQVWVDGSFIKKGSRIACGWGLAILRDGQEIHRASGSEVAEGFEAQWNIAGEVTAVLRALDWCRENGIRAVAIYHDYEGLAKWPLGQWKARNPYTQAYARAVRESGIGVDWRKVRAHSGESRNDLVDGLAREAAEAALSKA